LARNINRNFFCFAFRHQAEMSAAKSRHQDFLENKFGVCSGQTAMKKQIQNKSQIIQDKIFRKMPADKKVELGSQLWRLAKDLVGDKINYASRRSSASFSKRR